MLIDRPGVETVVVFPETTYVDADGNRMTRASDTGISVADCSVQTRQNSETDDIGFRVEQTYRLRLPRNSPIVLGAQSRVARTVVRDRR